MAIRKECSGERKRERENERIVMSSFPIEHISIHIRDISAEQCREESEYQVQTFHRINHRAETTASYSFHPVICPLYPTRSVEIRSHTGTTLRAALSMAMVGTSGVSESSSMVEFRQHARDRERFRGGHKRRVEYLWHTHIHTYI